MVKKFGSLLDRVTKLTSAPESNISVSPRTLFRKFAACSQMYTEVFLMFRNNNMMKCDSLMDWSFINFIEIVLRLYRITNEMRREKTCFGFQLHVRPTQTRLYNHRR